VRKAGDDGVELGVADSLGELQVQNQEGDSHCHDRVGEGDEAFRSVSLVALLREAHKLLVSCFAAGVKAPDHLMLRRRNDARQNLASSQA
jgi:hypothetical protein